MTPTESLKRGNQRCATIVINGHGWDLNAERDGQKHLPHHGNIPRINEHLMRYKGVSIVMSFLKTVDFFRLTVIVLYISITTKSMDVFINYIYL